MALQSVRIPVELEVQMREISSQIEKIRQLMGKISPDAKGYQKLENILKSMDREFQNIKKRSGETFNTHGQINTFSHKFEHLQTLAEDFGEVLKKIDFSAYTEDVFDKRTLDNIQQARDDIANLQKEINKVAGDAFLKTAKSSQELAEALKDIGVNSIDSLADKDKILDEAKIKHISIPGPTNDLNDDEISIISKNIVELIN